MFKALRRSLISKLRSERGEVDFGSAEIAVALPPALSSDPGFSSFKTVGDLAKGYREASTKAPVVDAAVLGGIQGEKFHALIPEDIRTKPYMKDINSFGDFVKKFDGAQALIGKSAMPIEGAAPGEWDAYFARNGRPEKPEDYKIPEVEGVPKEAIEGMTKNGSFQKILHAGGCNQQQVTRIATAFFKDVHAAELAMVQAGDAAFTKTMDSVFGQDRAAVVENGKKFLATYVPDSVKPLLAGLDDKAMAVVLAATDGIVKKHISEDGFRGMGGGGTGGGAETEKTIQAKMAEIMKDPAYSDPWKDRAKNESLAQQMEVLRGKLKALKGGQ